MMFEGSYNRYAQRAQMRMRKSNSKFFCGIEFYTQE